MGDVPALHRIFRIGKARVWGPETLVLPMQLTAAGKYRPTSFENWEYGLAAVIYGLGSDGAMHTLHNSPFLLPCRQTVVKHRQDFKLRVTVGNVKISDIDM
jgi:hypothetical protein